MNFTARSNSQGVMEMNDYTRSLLRQYCKKHPNTPFEIKPRLPESNKLRGYFEGCLVSLMTFYQEHLDHHRTEDKEKVRNWIKEEFNADFVEVDGKAHKVGMSTKGRDVLNRVSIEVQQYLMEQHATPEEAMDPKKYKYWRDAVFPYSGPDNWIDYLVERKVL